MIVAKALVNAIRAAATHNPDVQAAPACVLWPDHERLWEPVITQTQAGMPELLVLGDYAPENLRGPAIWLRCAIAGTLPEIDFEAGATPVLYLPGVSRQDLRAVSECPQALKPLAELQYRGVIWSQVNAKDWTPRAFLQSEQGGLGLDVDGSAATGRALLSALPHVLEEEVEALAGVRLDATAFNNLLTGGDPVRDLLRWLNDATATRSKWPDNAWQAFVQVCRSKFRFDPSRQSAVEGVQQLAGRAEAWGRIWDRYSEAPQRYPNIAEQIRQLPLPDFGLFPEPEQVETWPQWNGQQEQALYGALCGLEKLPSHEARQRLMKLEAEHAVRRDWLWATLGESPLALALEPLCTLARITSESLAGGDAADMRQAYANGGWQADDAVLRALACVTGYETQEAVTKAVRAVYTDWAEAAARHLQAVWQSGEDGLQRGQPSPHARDNECVLFVDGLRFDCGKRLAGRLQTGGFDVEENVTWAALPSVTGTGK